MKTHALRKEAREKAKAELADKLKDTGQAKIRGRRARFRLSPEGMKY